MKEHEIDYLIEKTYESLTNYCSKKNIDNDVLHDIYMKSRNTLLSKTGITSNDYVNYVKKSMWNSKMDEARSLRMKKTVELKLEERDKLYKIEKILEEEERLQGNDQQYREELEYFTRMLFKFIDVKSFTEIEVFIIKSYFLEDKMTYRKLYDKTGINISKITRTLRKFKKIVRNEFLDWINNNE